MTITAAKTEDVSQVTLPTLTLQQLLARIDQLTSDLKAEKVRAARALETVDELCGSLKKLREQPFHLAFQRCHSTLDEIAFTRPPLTAIETLRHYQRLAAEALASCEVNP